MSSIPLVCKICPKHPNFSDISHLLTHVGSKGHLSHYFKAQVRASHDNEALRQLQDYDSWYEDNNIERLLAQRMTAKDAKVTHRRVRRGTAPSINVAGRKRKSNPPTAVTPEEIIADSDEATLIDPQIAGIGQATGAHLPGPTSSSPKHQNLPVGPVEPERSVHAQQHAFLGPRRGNRYVQQEEGSDAYVTQGKDCLTLDGGTESIQTQQGIQNARPEDERSTSDQSYNTKFQPRNVTSHQAHGQHLVKEEEELDLNPLIKLKGPQWPGMALFDSASPETQRKRNQKKELTVLGQMEQDSREVQQIETIYFPDGSLKKECVITGVVESSSPVNVQSPKPKRRRGRRAALAEVDGNVQRMGEVNGRNKSATKVRNGRSTIWAGVSSSHQSTPAQTQTFEGDLFGASNEAEAEWVLNMGTSEYNSRRRLAVFREDAGSQHAESPKERHEILTNALSPGEASSAELFGNNYLTVGPSSRVSESISHGPESVHQPLDLVDAAPVRGDESAANSRKRAVAPMLSWKRCDDAVRTPVNHPRITQRYFSISANGKPHFFHQAPAEMDYGPFGVPVYDWQTFNPLNRNILQQQNPFYQNFPVMHATFATRFHGPQGLPKST